MDRMSGTDALLLHMEDDDTPMHTLKVVILDTARRGRPITLDELGLAVGSRLGLVPRSTQKVVAAAGFGARPYWIDDPEFDLRRHIDERTLATGAAAELDALYGELASVTLPRDRALWAMTLVHGLRDGRQAVVVRIHHAIVDGLGALNMLLAVSNEAPDGTALAPIPPAVAPRSPSSVRLALSAARDALRQLGAMPDTVGEVRSTRSRSRANRGHPDIPSFLTGFRRWSINEAGDATRTCASASLDLAAMRAISKATGTTVNGVLHAVIAGAVRSELVDRGEDVSTPCRAAFGIASDASDRSHLYGNAVTPTFVNLRSDLTDRTERLVATARSCTAAVEARRAAGLDLTDQLSGLAPRALNAARRWLTRRTTMNPSHVVTANVPGPRANRWLGSIEVVDWFSFAVAIAPASVNITVHSYAGRMNVGLIADPAALPDPQRLVARMADELDELTAAVSGRALVAA